MDDKLYNFKFNFIELNLLIKGCKELPYKESANLIKRIIDEYEVQSKAEEKKQKE